MQVHTSNQPRNMSYVQVSRACAIATATLLRTLSSVLEIYLLSPQPGTSPEEVENMKVTRDIAELLARAYRDAVLADPGIDIVAVVSDPNRQPV